MKDNEAIGIGYDESDRQTFANLSVCGPLAAAGVFLLLGVWWGWPTSFDQHDPTPRALRMLWNRTLDPGVYYWGAVGFQEALFFSVVPLTVLKKLLGLTAEHTEALMYLGTRILWAAKGIAIVACSYVTTRELFQDRIAAVAAAWAVALAPGFIVWAHIPQVDIVHAFWFSLALMLAVQGWRRSSLRYLYAAALCAGLAAGVKYVGGLVVLAPMCVAVLIRTPLGGLLHALLLGVLAVSVFVCSTPFATGDLVQWLPGYLADILANMNREVYRPIAFWTMPGAIWHLFGPGTAVIGVFSLVAWLFTRQGSSCWQPWVILAFAVLPYYIAIGLQHVATVRYAVPLIVPIAAVFGYAVTRTLALRRLRRTVTVLIGTAFAVQVVLALSFCLGLMFDSRYRLAVWLEENTRPGDKVETSLNHRPYFVGEHHFEEIGRPHFQAESHQMYTAMMEDTASLTRRLFDWSLMSAGYDPAEHPTWVEKERMWLEERGRAFDTSTRGPVARGSRYLAINLNTLNHYIFEWPGKDPASPNEREFFQSVLSEVPPYRKVARFESVVPEWLRYPRELWINISPTIAVFEVRADVLE